MEENLMLFGVNQIILQLFFLLTLTIIIFLYECFGNEYSLQWKNAMDFELQYLQENKIPMIVFFPKVTNQ
jgi:hypothetical protein